jgi:hypothetical protein
VQCSSSGLSVQIGLAPVWSSNRPRPVQKVKVEICTLLRRPNPHLTSIIYLRRLFHPKRRGAAETHNYLAVLFTAPQQLTYAHALLTLLCPARSVGEADIRLILRAPFFCDTEATETLRHPFTRVLPLASRQQYSLSFIYPAGSGLTFRYRPCNSPLSFDFRLQALTTILPHC